MCAYYGKVLEDTCSAINKCLDKNIFEINVRRVRTCNAIPSNARSKINFISRALGDLKKLGYLEYMGRNSPKKYRILKKSNFEEIKTQMNIQ